MVDIPKLTQESISFSGDCFTAVSSIQSTSRLMMLNHNSMLLPLINSFNPRADPYNLIHIAILFVLAVADSHRYFSLLPLLIQPQHPTLSFP